MNLKKLFETQKILRDRINYNEPDRFNKLILALHVEIGECANEWRGFKFWSKNQEPANYCEMCRVTTVEHKCNNPLLEEYVDGLHFVLELGIELDVEDSKPYSLNNLMDVTDTFRTVFECASRPVNVKSKLTKMNWFEDLLSWFLELGEMLGFTWEQIEQAYFEKNAVNHQRQEEGY